MEGSFFRQKSLNKIASPEELHDYMRVTSPRLWMVLIAVIILLMGFIAYASTARMENTIDINLDIFTMEMGENFETESGQLTICVARIPTMYSDVLEPGQEVRFGEYVGTLSVISKGAGEDMISASVDFDREYLPVEDGSYDAVLVLESTTPISFLLN